MSVHKSRGFTVIELITVIMIVGILAAVAVPGFRNLRINSQISAISGDMSVSLNRARSLAISTRTPVYLMQGPGSSATDMDAGDDWASGWRLLRGTTPAAATPVSKVVRAGSNTDVRVLVTNGAVDATGNAAGSAVKTIGFNGFGQLIAGDGSALAQAAIVICSTDDRVKESGRAIAVSRIGRIANNVVADPPCQDS